MSTPLADARPPAPAPAPKKKTRRWLIPAALATGAFFLLLAPLWAPVLLRRMAFFRVRHVEVVGARYVAPRDVVERLQVDTLASVWDPTGPLEVRVRAHPLVREAVVERKLPGTLVIRLVEHVPVALVPTTNGFSAYDERGVALPIDPARSDVDAPILSRPDRSVLRLLASAKRESPQLYHRLSEVRREGDSTAGARSELLFILDSLPVRTLADVTLHQLENLELVERDLARRRVRAAELDLRFRDQVIARLQ